jgi:hypothetical protein
VSGFDGDDGSIGKFGGLPSSLVNIMKSSQFCNRDCDELQANLSWDGKRSTFSPTFQQVYVGEPVKTGEMYRPPQIRDDTAPQRKATRYIATMDLITNDETVSSGQYLLEIGQKLHDNMIFERDED